MANSIRLGGGGSGGSATLITKSITQNGTYLATNDNADGYSVVTVNVAGGSIPTLKLNEGKITLTDGTISANSDYYYTDLFDCPQGSFFFDFGSQLGLNAGIVWYDGNGVYKNYYQANQRYRTVNMAQFYQDGYKMRVGFPKSALSATIFMDFNTEQTFTGLSPVQLTE